jgi:hypothetical protein
VDEVGPADLRAALHIVQPTEQPTERDRAREAQASQRERAALVERVAWLRAQGGQLYGVDPRGQLSAALYDFADLLEVLDDEGWWDR